MNRPMLDAVIVGAGFAGLYMLHRLRSLGFRALVLEAGGGVGGTWYWNRYPGARCDVESMEYSYQFSDDLQQEWIWTERYAAQPEILRYAEHVTDRFDLRRDIRFDTRVAAARFDEALSHWVIETAGGDRLSAAFCIMATGCLSSANTPAFPGGDRFAGERYHTARWPHEPVSFGGKRIGIIGTGSSAIQSIPLIAEEAKHLTVFQRTPNYTVPARNAPLDPEKQQRVKADYGALRRRAKTNRSGIDFFIDPRSALAVTAEERRREYEARWTAGGFHFLGCFADIPLDLAANETAQEFIRAKIRATVRDPEVAAKLSPSNVFGCKRLCVDSGYWETFNRPNVTLVDVASTPIEALTPTGVKVGGREYALDAIVFATGFDAMTGTLNRIDIRGRNGAALKDRWQDGPRTYLGLGIAGFPNLFTITGPGSPSVLTNMLPSIEQHVEWIADCLAHLRARGLSRIEADAGAEDAWVAHGAEVAGATLRGTCSSWYLGTNIEGKPRVFMPYIGGFPAYVQKCEQVVATGYDGFTLS
jgi:cation diffusion facilitator CzcD-associated flavoprotein CzcO